MNESEFITLGEVIHKMDAGERFDISVVTADTKRGTGGEIRTYTNCIKHMKHETSTIKSNAADAISGLKKHPNHYENSTRNIWLLKDRQIRKIHLRLITRFNGKKVL